MNGIKHIAQLTTLCCLLNGVLATTSTNPQSKFIISQQVPKGFEVPQKVQETHADVYFLGEYLQASLININPNNSVTILYPQRLVDQMRGVVNRQAIAKALSGPLSSNSGKKNIPNPKVASIIFDPKTLKMTVFVNSEYLERAKRTQVSLLEKPNNSVSLVNEFDSTVAGPQNNTDFNLHNNTILAYEDVNLTMLSNYFQHLTNTGDEDKKDDNFQVRQLYGTLQRWGKIIQTGMLKSKGDLFLETDDILGAGFSRNLNQIKNLKNIRGTPIPLFISSPSLVEVFRDGQLIYSARYTPGNHFLNTANFPEGSYNIDIRITDVGNNVRDLRRFFSKNPSFPPIGHPQYFINGGYLGKLEDNTNDYPLFQEYTNIAFGQAGGSIRLTHSLAAEENFIITSILTASESNLTWLHNQQLVKFALLLTNKGDYGTGIRYSTIWKKATGSISVNRIWGKHFSDQQKITGDTNIQPKSFDLVSLNRFLLSSSLSFPLGKARINANADIIQQFNQLFDRNYSLNVQYPLYDTTHIDINSQLSFNYNDGDKLSFLNISVTFKHGNWTNTLSGRGQHERFEQKNSRGQHNKTTGYLQFNSLWDKNVTGKYHVKLGGGSTYDTEYRQLSATSYLNNQDFLFSLDVDRNLPRVNGEKDNIQYNGRFNTSLVVAENEFGFENTEKGETGFLVDIESPSNADKFELLINDEPIQVINANEPTFIYSPPYQQYHVNIHSLSPNYYSYDQHKRTVTLYQNSVKYLQWQVEPQYSFITQLINDKGQAIKNAEITVNGKTALTNQDGDLHVEIPRTIRKLHIMLPNKTNCTVTLPNVTAKHDYVYVEKTQCSSHPDTTATSSRPT